MSDSNFDYKKFIAFVHEHFDTTLSLDEVENILHLEEEYTKDSPASLGKSLVLNRLIFSGKKLNGKEFYHDQKLYKGINVWIADNHKGKSTIFKIIKFALTGKDSIKPDIKPWIEEVILEFNLGKVTYTCHIDRTGRDKGALYSFGVDKFQELKENQKLDTIEKEKEFEFRTNIQFQEKIQDFFFEHFSFYTLKYTSHKSGKEDLGLSTGNLSWLTYFKSIYLESKNYEYLFFDNENMGAQGRKIFEMILGLSLTYPINMLGIQRDRVMEKIGKIKLIEKSKTETTKEKKEDLEKRLTTVTRELEAVKNGSKIVFDERSLVTEYNDLQKKVNTLRRQQRELNETYLNEKKKLPPLEEEIDNLERDRRKIKTEIDKLSKRSLGIDLYKEAGSFFSNLDIKTCPHCEVKVTEERKEEELSDHKCSLCGETSTESRVEEAELEDKAKNLEEEKKGHENKLTQVNNTLKQQRQVKHTLKKSINEYYSKLVAIPSTEEDSKRLKEIEGRIDVINNERKAQKKLLDKKEEWIKEEAILKFQLEQIGKEKALDFSKELDELNLKKDVLSKALELLERKRSQLNKDLLNKLERLILNEVHAFGLTSIDQIKIGDKYDLVFTQNEVTVGFKDLTEGEKLRVKLAFYLSLIQLDIEHSLGRHPRFLIFDSPGSEEMVPKHLHGLSDILKNVNERFEDQLQIFVGSALREFSQITDEEKTLIKEEDEFVF